MKLIVTLSGGFAGLENQPIADIDTDNLDEAAADEIHRCIERLFSEQEPATGSDMMCYTIDVDRGKETYRRLHVFDEANPNSDIRKLLSMLQ